MLLTMNNIELLHKLEKDFAAECQAAFYSECINPVTDAEKAHNKKLVDDILLLEKKIRDLRETVS